MNPQIEAASHDFKAHPRDRVGAAKKILGEIGPGRTAPDVESLLGPPTVRIWDYALFYSSTLTVSFDPAMRVTKIESDIADESDGSGDDKELPAIKLAVAQFKSQPYVRQDAARKLIPFLKIGMPAQEVDALLGRPNRTIWEYSLVGHSDQVLIVNFDENDRVKDTTLMSAPNE